MCLNIGFKGFWVSIYHTIFLYSLMCLNIGTPKTINFPFGTNGKIIVLGVPILKHIT